MEITYKDEEYFHNPSINKNQTGWYWFGNIIGKNKDPKLAMAEALDGLIGNIKIFSI
jgi:diphthine-ammonia ligase